MKELKKTLEALLPRNPFNINANTWFYTEKAGITVVYQLTEAGKYKQAVQFLIPWKDLNKAVSALKRAKKSLTS